MSNASGVHFRSLHSPPWWISRFFGLFTWLGTSIEAPRRLFGPSGILKTGLACQNDYPRSLFIDFTNIVKCKYVFCLISNDFLCMSMIPRV